MRRSKKAWHSPRQLRAASARAQAAQQRHQRRCSFRPPPLQGSAQSSERAVEREVRVRGLRRAAAVAVAQTAADRGKVRVEPFALLCSTGGRRGGRDAARRVRGDAGPGPARRATAGVQCARHEAAARVVGAEEDGREEDRDRNCGREARKHGERGEVVAVLFRVLDNSAAARRVPAPARRRVALQGDEGGGGEAADSARVC